MAKTWKYNENKNGIIIEPPKQTLRITGHRLATVLGLDPYSTPFKAWCEITKLVKAPFVETKYIIAGREAEPKIINYISNKLPNIVSIADYYGNIFKEYEYNNFKDDSKVFGGVIDAVATLNDGKTISAIVECKTSSNPQQWANGQIPVTYALQGALYSYLKGLDRIIFVCTFLNEMDYAHPEDITITDDNTIIVIKKLEDMIFEVDGEYLNIEGCIQKANTWWEQYIDTGISPVFDEKEDKEYLDMIRATDATQDSELVDVCARAKWIIQEIKDLKEDCGIDELEKELKSLETSIKNNMIENDISSCGNYKLTKATKYKFNEKLFAEEHENIYNTYLEETISYTLTKKKEEE